MQRIPLINSDKTALVSCEDVELVSRYTWRERKGHRTFYAYTLVSLDGDGFYGTLHMEMHRLLMQAPDKSFVDHIDGNGLNNQRDNLRFATRSQNRQNSCVQKGRLFKGTSQTQNRKRWAAQIRVNGKTLHLGTYLTELEAAQAYNEAAKEHFGEFARLNPV